MERFETIKKVIPNEGDYLLPDGWKPAAGEKIRLDDGFFDSSFPGCQFRIRHDGEAWNPDCAINLTVTGFRNM